MEINDNEEVAETYKDKLVVNATNNAPPPQYAMTTTMAATTKESGDNNGVDAENGNNDNEVDDT